MKLIDVVSHHPRMALNCLIGRSANVWREEHVVQFQQRVIWRHRVGFKYVERCSTDLAISKSNQQRGLLCNPVV